MNVYSPTTLATKSREYPLCPLSLLLALCAPFAFFFLNYALTTTFASCFCSLVAQMRSRSTVGSSLLPSSSPTSLQKTVQHGQFPHACLFFSLGRLFSLPPSLLGMMIPTNFYSSASETNRVDLEIPKMALTPAILSFFPSVPPPTLLPHCFCRL